MKKNFSRCLVLFCLLFCHTQYSASQANWWDRPISNQWSVEAKIGIMTPIKPMSEGASTSFLSSFPNHFGIGLRHMFNEYIGIRATGYLDNLKNGPNSREFHSRFLSGSLHGVADVGRFLNVSFLTRRVSLLGYFGMFVSFHELMHSVPDDAPPDQPPQGTKERDGGFKIGILPQVSMSRKLTISFDLNFDLSFRRHMAWDGLSYDGLELNRLEGSKWTISVGLVYSLN